MCGLTGFLGGPLSRDRDDSEALLSRMSDAILHRGPDGGGVWSDPGCAIGLAHRRLAIVDLSAAGAQPMSSPSGRFVIAFNGEIYNHLRIREDIERERSMTAPWRGTSDTETFLSGVEAWGLTGMLERSIGMFALAIWDRKERVLHLARDRIGEKPLYYGRLKGGPDSSFVFGSEISALRRHPAFQADVDRNALASYLRHNYVGGEASIYKGIRKLPPGSMLSVSLENPEPVLVRWWSGVETVMRGASKRFPGTPAEAVDSLESLLKDAIGQQMVADVPLGAFLSGGVDSSTVVALMQSQSMRPVRTFSIGFNEPGYDEAVHAKAVAKHLGTDHTELYVTHDEARAVIPKLPLLYSEPFADSSQIPTFLVSQLARAHVTVSLSGDAGDELFCGYNRYQLTSSIWKKIAMLPRGLRLSIARGVLSVGPGHWDRVGRIVSASRLGDRLHKGASLLGSRSISELYRSMVSHWEAPESVVLDATEPLSALTDLGRLLDGLGDIERMMALDLLTYLPDDILVKVDRAAMGVSLETRVPFLDHRVVEFAWSLPFDYKLRNGVTKWPLREVLYRHVPRAMIERPKMGFGVPIDSWLRGPLRDWAESLISSERLAREGFFDPRPIRVKWEEHLSGRRNWQYLLWDVLVFQAWLENSNR
jgi:asparagine synthase (glutamine-hydrolysing)